VSDYWQCGTCGTDIAMPREVCWRCGSPRPISPLSPQAPRGCGATLGLLAATAGIILVAVVVGIFIYFSKYACHGPFYESGCHRRETVATVVAWVLIPAGVVLAGLLLWRLWSKAPLGNRSKVWAVADRSHRGGSWLCRGCGADVAPADEVCPWCDTARPESLGDEPMSDGLVVCPSCSQRTAPGSECQWCDQPIGGEG